MSSIFRINHKYTSFLFYFSNSSQGFETFDQPNFFNRYTYDVTKTLNVQVDVKIFLFVSAITSFYSSDQEKYMHLNQQHPFKRFGI